MSYADARREAVVPKPEWAPGILVGRDFSSLSDSDQIDLHYFTPPPDLQLHIGSVCLFSTDGPQVAETMCADFPQLRFMLSGSGHYSFSNTVKAKTPMVCMLGPTMGATRFLMDGPLQMLGVVLLPLGWIALTGRDASVHVDRVYDMTAGTDGDTYAVLLSRLKAINVPEEAVALLWDHLRARMAPVRPAIQTFVAAVDDWLAKEASPQVQDLRDATGLSERQVSRLTNRIYGASPKYLARKYRALRFAAQTTDDRRDRQNPCYDAFYDQSHVIREIKHFIGCTPGQLINAPMAPQMRDAPIRAATLRPFCA